MEPTLKVAKKYPNVHFEHSTGYKRDANMSTLLGALVSGSLHTGDHRGQDVEIRRARLISAHSRFRRSSPASTPPCSVAQTINPNIKVKIIWANSWFDPGKEADGRQGAA